MKPAISIIIPTLHRRESLLRLLRSMNIDSDTEILIVEQGRNDGKTYKAFARKNYLNLHYYFFDGHNTAKAKNIGALHAKGDYFVFYDDDVILHAHAVKNLVKSFQDKRIGAVGGRVLTPGQQEEPDRADTGRLTAWGSFTDGFSSTKRQDIQTLIGCNMAVRADIFKKVGGFDEHFKGAFREDSDISMRILTMGYRVTFNPAAAVTHLREPTGGGRKSEGRFLWYKNFFSNDTYFFLKHRKWIYFPIFLFSRVSWIIRSFYWSPTVAIRGIIGGFTNYYDYRS